MTRLRISHNLSETELTKAVVSMTKAHGLESVVVEELLKAKQIDDAPKEPKFPAMRGLYQRFRDLYQDAASWITGFVDGMPDLQKSIADRMLTKEDIRLIQEAIRERFGFIAAQIESDYVPDEDTLNRWKSLGIITDDVTPSTFALVAENHLIRNAFIFGRLYQAVEAGKTYEEVLHLALNAPLLKPDFHAIAVAEQQTANYITAMGDELAKVAGQTAAAANRQLIRDMAVKFHSRELQAKVLDEELKREMGAEIPIRTVDTWKGFSSELYHAMEDKARDWDRIAFFELHDARGQGQALSLLEEFGPKEFVYKVPLPTACPQCKFLYLQDDGVTPKLYRLTDMIGWGNNVGRKPYPVRGGMVAGTERDDGAETLKAVCGQIHPWCMCLGPHKVTGYENWIGYYKGK